MKEVSLQHFFNNRPRINSKTNQNDSKTNQVNAQYLKIYSLYKYGLELYLNKLLDIEKYDNFLLNSPFNFFEIKEKDFYQFYNNLDTKYFYLRNDLYIERLSKEDIDKLESININDADGINKLLSIVHKTFHQVIKKYEDASDNTYVSYSVNDFVPNIPNNAVIFGVCYDEYANDSLGDNWEENYFNQNELLYSIIDEMEYRMSLLLKIPVKVIKYTKDGIIELDTKSK